ncbi:hypothetical protein P7247_24445 [Vibrio parahaemolyticus]|nr:hypothetical protein [Vibrio parahaemolyticus]
MELVSPSPEFESAFLVMYKDFADNDPENSEYYSESIAGFSAYVQVFPNPLARYWVRCE